MYMTIWHDKLGAMNAAKKFEKFDLLLNLNFLLPGNCIPNLFIITTYYGYLKKSKQPYLSLSPVSVCIMSYVHTEL